MKKSFIIAGGILVLFLTLLFPSLVFAKEGDCHLEHCLVPSPTVLGPKQNEITAQARPAIIGLTWKTTVVKVYLDGIELKNVKQVKHQDYYGSFYVQPNFNLKPGRHFIYTIAHSEKPGLYDQSQESTYIYFTVKELAAKSVAQAPENFATAEVDSLATTSPMVTVTEGKIEGGVSVEAADENVVQPNVDSDLKPESAEKSDLQPAATFAELGESLNNQFQDRAVKERAARNRLIGILLLIALAVIVWLLRIINKQSIRSQFKEKEDNLVPPPPAPPIKTEAKEKSEPEILVAPIEEIVKEEPTYWATPPESPYSYAPYPEQNIDSEKDPNKPV
jgi:cell division septation protein DedD